MIDARFPKRTRTRRTLDSIRKHQQHITSAVVGVVAAYYTTEYVMQRQRRSLEREMANGHFMIPLKKPNRYVRIPVLYDPDNENV